MRDEALIGFFLLPFAVAAQPCAVCHPQIATRWAGTGMARSLTRPSADAPDRPVTVRGSAANRYYQVLRDADGLAQTEYELDAVGNPLFRVTHRLELALGSGTVGR